jgi:hypothetical protein
MMFKDIAVDAGIILIADEDYYQRYEGLIKPNYDKLGKKHDLQKGKYYVEWKISQTWNGKVSGNGILNVTSGKILICDPCYIISNYNQWDKILNNTNFFKYIPEGTLVLDTMGGDGIYNINISFKKINGETND